MQSYFFGGWPEKSSTPQKKQKTDRGQDFYTHSQRLSLPPTSHNGEPLRFNGNTCSLNLFLNIPDIKKYNSPIENHYFLHNYDLQK